MIKQISTIMITLFFSFWLMGQDTEKNTTAVEDKTQVYILDAQISVLYLNAKNRHKYLEFQEIIENLEKMVRDNGIIDYKLLEKMRDVDQELYEPLHNHLQSLLHKLNNGIVKLSFGTIHLSEKQKFDELTQIIKEQEKRIDNGACLDPEQLIKIQDIVENYWFEQKIITILKNLEEKSAPCTAKKKVLAKQEQALNTQRASETQERDAVTTSITLKVSGIGAVLTIVGPTAHKLYKKYIKDYLHKKKLESFREKFKALKVQEFIPKPPKPPRPLRDRPVADCACTDDVEDQFVSVDSITYAAGDNREAAAAASIVTAAAVKSRHDKKLERRKELRGIKPRAHRGFVPRRHVPVSAAVAAAHVESKDEKQASGKYTIMNTDSFSTAYEDLNSDDRTRVNTRTDNIREGFFGDHKQFAHGHNRDRIDGELRWQTGLRVYYTIIVPKRIIYLLRIGDKSSNYNQNKDIKHAEAQADVIHAAAGHDSGK